MNNNKKWLWALVCVLILIVLGSYLYTADPLGWRSMTDTGSQQSATPETGDSQSADSGGGATDQSTASDTGTQAASGSEAQTASEEAQTASESETETAAALPVPSFDLVRVEPDGSTLIAGKAGPGAEVEVVANGKVIATVTAGSTGDFAAVLDDKLPAGDHEIVLRVSGEGDATAQSEEVATISVPESEPGNLLVMVTKPGEASRILTKPEMAASTESAAETSDKAEENQTTEKVSSQADETQVAAADTSGSTEMAKTDAAAETGVIKGDDAGADAQTPATESVPQTSSVEESATAATNTASISTSVSTATDSALRIDAVEIENGRIFVAGRGTPGGQVRVYADGELIGHSSVSPGGLFLVEAERDLAVGNHTISAELVMQAGAAPVIRVAVPFARPEGQMVAAIAAPETATDTDATAQDGTQVAAASQDQSGGGGAKTPGITMEEPLPSQSAGDDQAEAGDKGSAGTSTQLASTDSQSDETPTIVQPALQQQDNSVIIRRGDTLWQISRRIYGQGVRYTTIYLANEHMIEHPDWIEPGQIFAVPETPLENAEELHRQYYRKQ